MKKHRPTDIKYSSTHTWVRMETDKDAIIGVTDTPFKGWSEVKSIDLPKKGIKVKQDMTLAKIESEDSLQSVISPLSGKILLINPELAKNPSLITEEPYDDGWLMKIRIEDPSELTALMERKDYEELVKEEEEEAEAGKEIFEEIIEEDDE
ncbi:MAG: glycine cleavage system protein H [Planctomycetes bacterium]|nr:glycine cleavage system protein H [Planctomycetota bacterium]